MLPAVSHTFHGRDIFAPAAAYLASGIAPSEFGPEIKKTVTLQFAKIVKKGSALIGEVLHTDSFGNIVTNFGEKELGLMNVKGVLNVKIKGVALKLKLGKTYAEAKPKKPLAIIGSHNFLEISLNQDNAAKKYRAKAGDKIELRHT
jgi:S-adenosylmethionine hydrolase